MNTRRSNQDKAGMESSSSENYPVDICLICCSKINYDQIRKNGYQLCKNLRVIFLLRNLLQVPKDQVAGNLRKCGNPDNWIRLCDQCSELTREGQKLYLKIVKIDKELRSIRSQIVNKIRSESQSSDDIEVTDDNVKISGQDIWRKTRDFVINYDYSDSIDINNPFSKGDNRAETLTNQIGRPISPLNPGNHGDSDDGADDDDNLSVYIKDELDEDEETDDSDDDKEEDYDDKECCDDWDPGETKKKVPSTSSPKKRTRRPPIIIDGKYKCHHCDELFNNPQGCHKHEQKLHFSKTSGQFPCDLCGKLNDTLGFLNEHKRVAHKIKADGTPVAITKRYVAVTLTNRKRRPAMAPIIIDGKYQCHYCDKLFSLPQTCHKHEQKLHFSWKQGQFPCDLCSKLFNSRGFLTDHKRTAHKIKADGTPVPRRSHSIKFTHRKNQKAVVINGKYKCRQCDRMFNDRQTCYRHEQIHKSKRDDVEDVNAAQTEGPWKQMVLKDKKWACLYCNKRYTNKLGCYIHIVEKHERTPGSFICDICGISWEQERYLNIHKSKLHNVTASGTPVVKNVNKPKKEPQTCEICGKTYATKVCLHNHVRFVHEKRFKSYCQFCGMGFYSSPALQRHLLSMHEDNEDVKRMMEEGAKIWRCEVVGCSTKFVKETGFVEHMKKVHGGDKESDVNEMKKFTCSFCGKGFWRQSKLQQHELIHKNAEEKPFSCEICGVRMATPGYVRNHKRQVHKIRVNVKLRDDL